MDFLILLLLMCVVCCLLGLWVGYMAGYSSRIDDERNAKRANQGNE